MDVAGFNVITLTLVRMLALALVYRGIWAALAFSYITVFIFVMDKTIALAALEPWCGNFRLVAGCRCCWVWCMSLCYMTASRCWRPVAWAHSTRC